MNIRKIIREVLLEEFKTKTPIGKGKEHNVYNYEGDPSKVIKVRFGKEGVNQYDFYSDVETKQLDLDPNHIATFKNNPDLFPEVFKFTNRYAIIDKLNTKPIKAEQAELYKVLESLNMEDLDHMTEHNAINRLYWVMSNRKGFAQKLMKKAFETGVFFASPLLQKYIDFTQRIISSPLGKKNKNLDVSDVNIGYDGKGGLKLLDF